MDSANAKHERNSKYELIIHKFTENVEDFEQPIVLIDIRMIENLADGLYFEKLPELVAFYSSMELYGVSS